MKKKNLIKFGAVLFLATGLYACKKDRAIAPDQPVAEAKKEEKYVRLLVADETATKLSLLDPSTGKTTAFDTKYPLASLYATASGRYAGVIYAAQNLVEVFDNGLSTHDDHIDVVGDAKFTSFTADGIKPAHFKSKGNETLIFNDGEGTLSIANDADFKTTGKFKKINAGLQAHHGAMAQFGNGTIAVTSTSTDPSGAVVPNKVIVIDKTGATVKQHTKEVGAIHGNASDGNNAVFGAFTGFDKSAGGVLVVNENGTQKFINNPDKFGAFRLGTILYAPAAKKFIGYVATKGAYLVDVDKDKITPIYEGNDSYQCKVDYAGKNLLILTLDGKLRIYDLVSGALKKEGAVTSAVQSADTYKPVIEATSKFAYIAVPTNGEVLQVDLSSFKNTTKIKVTARPVRMALFGFESSASH